MSEQFSDSSVTPEADAVPNERWYATGAVIWIEAEQEVVRYWGGDGQPTLDREQTQRQIGQMDTPEQAAQVVALHNGQGDPAILRRAADIVQREREGHPNAYALGGLVGVLEALANSIDRIEEGGR